MTNDRSNPNQSSENPSTSRVKQLGDDSIRNQQAQENERQNQAGSSQARQDQQAGGQPLGQQRQDNTQGNRPAQPGQHPQSQQGGGAQTDQQRQDSERRAQQGASQGNPAITPQQPGSRDDLSSRSR